MPASMLGFLVLCVISIRVTCMAMSTSSGEHVGCIQQEWHRSENTSLVPHVTDVARRKTASKTNCLCAVRNKEQSMIRQVLEF